MQNPSCLLLKFGSKWSYCSSTEQGIRPYKNNEPLFRFRNCYFHGPREKNQPRFHPHFPSLTGSHRSRRSVWQHQGWGWGLCGWEAPFRQS